MTLTATRTVEEILIVDQVAYITCGNGHEYEKRVGSVTDEQVHAAAACPVCHSPVTAPVDHLGWAAALDWSPRFNRAMFG